MKNINEYINESLIDNVKNTLNNVVVKIFKSVQANYLDKEHKFLQDFLLKYKKYIVSHFDINDQQDTGYILYEYGVVNNIRNVANIVFDEEYGDNTYSDKLKKAIKSSKYFKLSKDEENFWYMPAFEILGIDFNEIDEEVCIKSADDLYFFTA